MTKDQEIAQLKRKLYEKDKFLLAARTDLAEIIVQEYGEKAEELIKTHLNKLTRQWAAGVAESDKQAGKDNDIQGLIDFLWEPLREEGFDFTFDLKDDCCQMRVTKCPIADIAKELNMEKWGYNYHCMGDAAICEGYNSEMLFERTNTLMEGKDHCDHYYELKKDLK